MIMVRLIALGRTGAAISTGAEIVERLRSGRLACGKRTRARWNIVCAPMAERPSRRVRVVDDERQALGAGEATPQLIGGDWPGPSQVYWAGIGWPVRKASLPTASCVSAGF